MHKNMNKGKVSREYSSPPYQAFRSMKIPQGGYSFCCSVSHIFYFYEVVYGEPDGSAVLKNRSYKEFVK